MFIHFLSSMMRSPLVVSLLFSSWSSPTFDVSLYLCFSISLFLSSFLSSLFSLSLTLFLLYFFLSLPIYSFFPFYIARDFVHQKIVSPPYFLQFIARLIPETSGKCLENDNNSEKNALPWNLHETWLSYTISKTPFRIKKIIYFILIPPWRRDCRSEKYKKCWHVCEQKMWLLAWAWPTHSLSRHAKWDCVIYSLGLAHICQSEICLHVQGVLGWCYSTKFA